jgi:cytochrome c556
MRSLLLAAAFGTAAVATVAYAQDRHPAVKARQAYFQLLGANVGPLAAMAKGEMEYSAETAALHAKNLMTLTSYTVTPHFPEGTSNDDLLGETRALPVIWSDFDGFVEKYVGMVEQVEALQGAAGEGRAALGPALGQLGGSCKACHDDYRAKDF